MAPHPHAITYHDRSSPTSSTGSDGCPAKMDTYQRSSDAISHGRFGPVPQWDQTLNPNASTFVPSDHPGIVYYYSPGVGVASAGDAVPAGEGGYGNAPCTYVPVYHTGFYVPPPISQPPAEFHPPCSPQMTHQMSPAQQMMQTDPAQQVAPVSMVQAVPSEHHPPTTTAPSDVAPLDPRLAHPLAVNTSARMIPTSGEHIHHQHPTCLPGDQHSTAPTYQTTTNPQQQPQPAVALTSPPTYAAGQMQHVTPRQFTVPPPGSASPVGDVTGIPLSWLQYGNQLLAARSNQPPQYQQGHKDPKYHMDMMESMHLVWAERFRSNFSNFRDRLWSLKPTMEPPTGDWKVHHDSAKIRFICKNDHNCWTSMKGRVVFWYAIDNGNGFVYFKLFGQQCKKCKKDEFQDPIWYPEEVVKVVDNIYYRVGQAYYNFSSQGPSSVQLRRDRRPGRPREQHDSTRCQACRDGLCTEART